MICLIAASTLCRTAAAQIRQLATEASVFAPSPWRAEPAVRNGTWPADYVANSGGGPRFKPPSAAQAAHIAAWSPAPASAVADVLDRAADEIDALPPGAVLPPLLSLTVRLAESLGRVS